MFVLVALIKILIINMLYADNCLKGNQCVPYVEQEDAKNYILVIHIKLRFLLR